MKFINSLGFLLLGGAMFAVPQVAPGLCPVDLFGNSVRADWLHVMGLTQTAIGSAFILRRAGAELATWLARWPELVKPAPVAPVAPDFDPVPQAAAHAYRHVHVYGMARPQAEVIPVDFKPAWAEKQAA
jgi:hypothetical protein